MEQVYRKYSNNQRFFKILDDTRFHEIQVIGNKFQQYLIEAKSYPEKLFIQDLISCSFDGIEAISENDFDALIDELRTNATEIKPRQN